jgi:hypothetical protein
LREAAIASGFRVVCRKLTSMLAYNLATYFSSRDWHLNVTVAMTFS